MEKKHNFSIPKCLWFIIIGVALLLVGYFVFVDVKGNEFSDSNTTYVIRR